MKEIQLAEQKQSAERDENDGSDGLAAAPGNGRDWRHRRNGRYPGIDKAGRRRSKRRTIRRLIGRLAGVGLLLLLVVPGCVRLDGVAVVAICEGIRRDLTDRGIEDGKITLVPNGVDPAEFVVPQRKDAALSASLDLDGKIVLGFLGSFYDYEGLDLLLSATQRILKQVPQLVVLLAGGGPEDEALRRMASDLGIASSVRFVGRVPHREVPRYYSLVDLFLYPRRSMRLTESVTPLKPLEAMARGGIVLASNVGGHRELLADGATGYLFEPGDVDALAKAVLRTLERRSEWGAIGRRARAFVETERSWACCTAGYRNAYRSALAGHDGQV